MTKCIFFVSARYMETLEKIFNLTLKMKIFNIILLCHIIRANYFIESQKVVILIEKMI
jgi:hypothetical protein